LIHTVPFPVLLLAAGRGIRLDPLTRLVAKPAVPIAGRTLIELVVDRLVAQGATDVVVNLHYLPHTITGVLGDGAHLGARVRYSWEQPDVLGSAGGPRHALPLLDSDEFLIVNGDTLSDVALADLIGAHRRTGAEATLALIPNPAPHRYGGVVVNEDDSITGFLPKGAPDNAWHFVGLQVANATLFAPLEDGVPVESVGQVYREAIAARPGSIRAWRTTGTFIDVGTPRDYFEAATTMRGPRVEPRGPLIWPDASIDADAALHRCIVASGVHVPRGFHAEDAILVPAAFVRDGDRCDVRDGIAVFRLTDHSP
jgi:NDP-sugar pyrophosphorylase family protein